MYTAAGTLLDIKAIEGRIYEFSGFASNGVLYFVGYHNYVYWGYEHDMKTLITTRVENNKFSRDGMQIIKNLCQIYYSEHQDCARLIDDKYLVDWMGNVYDTTNVLNGRITFLLAAEHVADEQLDEYDDLSSIGTRIVCNEKSNVLYGYTSGKNLIEYDLESKSAGRKYKTSHYVFNLLELDDKLIAIERENNSYYCEVIAKSDFRESTAVTINLNERDIYSSHTKETVKKKWREAQIASDIKVYKSTYSLSPYKEAAYTDSMKKAMLDYSNYMRWLGGLTPFSNSEEEVWSAAGKGALLLTKINELEHDPSKPSDMSEDYYKIARNACSDSNLISGGIREGKAQSVMSFIVEWLDDTSNVSAYELGHRFEFLQRSADRIAYGGTDRVMLQTVEVYENQINETGTVRGVDNNDYCYSWPGAGYFPNDAVNTRALWSVNFNADKIDVSSSGMSVKIKDLGTGTITDVTSSIGSSAYLGFNQYYGYFKGEYFYFDSPNADSYVGKNYQVTIEGLELTNGDPAIITYTVNFFNPNQDFHIGDLNQDNEVSNTDVVTLARHLAGLTSLGTEQLAAADVNHDGSVDNADLVMLARAVAGLTTLK